MPQKPTTKKSRSAKKVPSRTKAVRKSTAGEQMKMRVSKLRNNLLERRDEYLARRPHRTFRMTRRRDYVRSLDLPGYWSFTNYVRRTLWENKRLFGTALLVYALMSGVFVGLASQETYSQLSDTIRESGDEILGGDWSQIEQAGILFLGVVSSGVNTAPTEAQQVFATIFGFLAWLTMIWLLRHVVAGHTVKLRDGLYQSGAPILPTLIISIILAVQLIPLAIAVIGFVAANNTGLLSSGVEAMLFWAALGLLALLPIYWVSSTFMALIIVTLPGMYPFQALRTAGDLVVGRRIRILLRMVWLLVGLAVFWTAVMIPLIIFDTWLKQVLPVLEWLPLVPVALLLLVSVSVVWGSAYTYLLYRKVVEDDAKPA